MARILSVDPERARGVRKVMFRMNERQYGGVVPGIFQILAQDLSIATPPPGSTTTFTCASPRR